LHGLVAFAVIFFYAFMYWIAAIPHYLMIFLVGDRNTPKGYAPIRDLPAIVFANNIYGRIADCWDRPVIGTPGAYVDLVPHKTADPARVKRSYEPSEVRRCINLGSYNYLGFSENKGICLDANLAAANKYGPSACSTRYALGQTDLLKEVEKTVANFLGKEDAIVYCMGFGTNSSSIPAFIGKGGLIVSDELNHASLVNGCRLSGAAIRVFKHNSVTDLERVLREAIAKGQPPANKTSSVSGPYKPWDRIIILIEGLYSMEGDIAPLPEIIALKKKYKAYLYIDEAHSIGSLGESGRGVVEYWGCEFADVDVMMGTFTKSFASTGGYVASSRAVIHSMRAKTYGSYYDLPLSPSCCSQILASFRILSGQDGSVDGIKRIESLRNNSIYLRSKMKERGFVVMGDYDSPVIPVLLYSPTNLACFSRLCLEQNIATVIVGPPATETMMARVRFCVSAAHTKEDLDKAIEAMTQVGDIVMGRHNLNKSLPNTVSQVAPAKKTIRTVAMNKQRN
jgi:serine palmitoyltransferase